VISLPNGRNQHVTRVIWEAQFGPIGKGLLVCHRCDVPACCSIDHLFLGTAADNTADMMQKRRHVKAMAKLTPTDVHVIRMRATAGDTQRAIARSYGLDQSTISDIITRRTWRDVA